MICLLEDDPVRIEQFHRAIGLVAPDLPFRIWRDAQQMLRELPDYLDRVVLISLDHDLRPTEGATEDPGCGYDVAKVLGELIPCCPIIIHTSNSERGTWMEGELSRAGWKYERVSPLGDDWIEREWAPLVARMLDASKA
jgi:hypothetical protein